MKFKGFTLAEIMIALTVIGVITSILLPVALQSVPDENIMKFKKGNATLAKVITELVTSGEYYTIGDLGVKPDGVLINGDRSGDYAYFCRSFADIINAKSINCVDEKTEAPQGHGGIVCSDWDVNPSPTGTQVQSLDYFCKTYFNSKSEIISSDGISYWEPFTSPTFGWDKYEYYLPDKTRLFLEPVSFMNQTSPEDSKINEVDGAYRCKKVFCMDVDGVNKGEDPFGYGIRVDGKIILGERAQEWINKSIQEK